MKPNPHPQKREQCLCDTAVHWPQKRPYTELWYPPRKRGTLKIWLIPTPTSTSYTRRKQVFLKDTSEVWFLELLQTGLWSEGEQTNPRGASTWLHQSWNPPAKSCTWSAHTSDQPVWSTSVSMEQKTVGLSSQMTWQEARLANRGWRKERLVP